ncbi:protein bride of sevenless [Culex quinquefasciatus]|uniref:protein bride of sevenless n=1 Tax=Culex quinquefasciatus TaxID=7176 RepID=UPI0018E34646|nr:protein bride of sevenless [Culex quinquefasciatus]XP_038117781.1 protein bride of sevenless [Culex quinquefasciatus]XP_038117782.1 protein bride of sevenless [Culex quinquefasciatus]XP_038117783.1 protein bride of sevenless [Culex quinquefasciatus]XP_038117784.1 protein bride of sevenless [Culex quinquefasciatus]XP_038117785.1 protein bride of sevenless [Culex quinquefasciatus]
MAAVKAAARSENAWRKMVCVFAFLILHLSTCTASNEIPEFVPNSTPKVDESTISDHIASVENILTTNSIDVGFTVIDPTVSSFLEELASLGTSTDLLTETESDASDVVDNATTVDVTTPLVRKIASIGEAQAESSTKATTQQGKDANSTICSRAIKNVLDLTGEASYAHTKYHQLQPAYDWDGHKSAEAEANLDFGHITYSHEGDYTVSLITDQADFGAWLFVVDRINELQLIENNGTLGLRILFVRNLSQAHQSLEEEVVYQKDCSTNSIGIFVTQTIWSIVHPLVDTPGISVHPLPTSNDLLYAKAAHLLYELPWSNPNASIAVRSESSESTNKFTEICRHEHLCLENFPSNDTIFIILGMTKSVSFATNGTLIVVLSGKDMLFVSDLPDKSYVIAENEISMSSLENLLNISSERYGQKILASDLLLSGSVFLEVVELLNLPSEDGSSLNETLNNWNYYARMASQRIISELKLDNITQLMSFELRQKFNSSEGVLELKPVASSNMVTNVTTVFHLNDYKGRPDEPLKLGNIFYCTKEFEIRHPDFSNRHRPIYLGEDYVEMFWQVKQEAWVAAGLTVSSLGILFCLAILIFLIVRVCMDDVLEGNPLSSILLLISLIFQFGSFLPFSLEYTGYMPDLMHSASTMYTWNTLCTIKIFLVSLGYCTTFSLLLCRAIMLASIGSEGGFLSHVNGYLQSVICGFSTLVQLGLSTQLVIILHANSHNISCNEIYFGNWFWAVIAYDGMLLAALVFLSPFIFRSQRNYREGLLLVTGSILCLVIWTTWIPLCMFGYEWREAAISLGLVATALVVLVGIMIPRCFLMVRSIARSDLVQALPSLTSLAFAQANQYISEQSVYECVNPAMRHQRSSTTESFMEHEIDDPYLATSEIPTLPLRGNRRSQPPQQLDVGIVNGNGTTARNGSANFYGISNPYNSCTGSITSELSPNKITRF